jgi:hypothetical protein
VEVGVALISTFLAIAANANNAEGRIQNAEVDAGPKSSNLLLHSDFLLLHSIE